ncbi:RsmD family RNA methyltransferase [Kordia sp. YSTF-M3]|uniref:RsmD family RNA methyltransferase n=1 Tax=Kordia aestuariivivens TaxID=2759037 RepID=A0ABR7Q7R0_9FLAO|nr:class I SAM-dependent methyltransferase [Kordia aestuariivivens]MBC8754607.1 RsmD family RNA methyltransferase [Kordia aestuariivivens]
MNLALLTPKIQQFITEHLHDDPTTLLLKHKEVDGIPFAEIIEQIQAKARCEKKLPTWFNAANSYFPNKLNIEQTSSEQTAKYKASLIKGTSLIDLTGGFGVDCYAFSKQFQEVTHCEISPELSKIVAHNYKVLEVSNIKTIATDGIEYLQNTPQTFDCIYIDPSRRNDVKGKVFLLEDCLPDVVTHQNLLFQHATTLLIKTAPLLDITNGLRSLKHVKEVHVVAVHNEVKELLWLLDKNASTNDVLIKTVNLKKETSETFDFDLSEEKELQSTYGLPKKYLYEPNAAILKAGAFLSIAKAFQLQKLHQHSHLYTSDSLIPFPGRRFEVQKILPYTKKIIKKELNLKKANITTRNFPESVAAIRKKLSISDGGIDFLFLTTVFTGKKVVIHCKKT